MSAGGSKEQPAASGKKQSARSRARASDSSSDEEDVCDMTTEAIAKLTGQMAEQVDMMRGDERAAIAHSKELEIMAKASSKAVMRACHLPHTIATVVELLEEDEGGYAIKTSGRLDVYVDSSGMADPACLKPGTLVGVHPTTFVIHSVLADEYDTRALAMMVDKRPTEQWNDVGGLDKQIAELKEAVVLPITHKALYSSMGITPPRGVLLYGPPGTGKTMLARAVAAQCQATFIRLGAPQLVQQYIGDGARIVRDAFKLARDNPPAIVFIDELDAIGAKRRSSGSGGGREVHRTLMELLNQLDGFAPDDCVKLIAATNRVDVLDPALLRSGRLDKKIELPLPDVDARQRIMRIHAAGMRVHTDVNYGEVSRSTDGFNGAQCRAVAVEAAMAALRRDATLVTHEDFMDAVAEVSGRQRRGTNAATAAMFT